MKPLVRFCLRHSVKIQDAVECLKLEFIEGAREEIAGRKERLTDSRLSVVTGLQRRDITRLQSGELPAPGAKDLISKVVGQWLGDKRFLTGRGKPRVLSAGFEGCDFDKLVRTVSRDLNPATVLFELERVKSVTRTAQGVQLATESYLPSGDAVASFKILSQDVNDLIDTVETNTLKKQDILHHHLRTEYDRVREDALPEIKAWFLREGHLLHQKARDFVSQFDLDINPDLKSKEPGKKVVFASFGKVDGD